MEYLAAILQLMIYWRAACQGLYTQILGVWGPIPNTSKVKKLSVQTIPSHPLPPTDSDGFLVAWETNTCDGLLDGLLYREMRPQYSETDTKEGVEILLHGSGVSMSVDLYSCAIDCAADTSCLGITVADHNCQLHHRDLGAAQYKRKKDCLTGPSLQQPPVSLINSGGSDTGHHFIVVLEPFQQTSFIHTINFYAGTTAGLRFYVVDALDERPTQVRISKMVDITDVAIGYNSRSVDGIEASAGQYYAFYWGATWVLRFGWGVRPIALTQNIPQPAEGDVVALVVLNQHREYRLELLYTTC